jgi:hypothetical protein
MGADFHKTTGTVAARDFYFSKGTNVFFLFIVIYNGLVYGAA